MKKTFRTVYDPGDEEHLYNPYKIFEHLRKSGELVETFENQWLTTTYSMAQKVLLNRSFGRGDMYRVEPFEEVLSPVEIMRENWMLFCDPPKHTRLKKLSMEILSKYINERTKIKIEEISLHLLERVNTNEPFDLIAEYAHPLPLLLIAEMLGVPKSDRELFKQWAHDVNQTLEPCCSLEEKRHGDKVVESVYTYFDDLVKSKGVPEHSMLNMLMNYSLDGEKLNYDEMIYTAILLLISGHETTSSMTGLGMLTLTKFPDVYLKLKDNPLEIPLAIEELIRYEPAVQLARRVALEDCKVDERKFKKGDMITVAYGAANYDPSVFERPYEFIIGRKKKHLSFGFGNHHCLGSRLAILEAEVVFRHLVQKLPRLCLYESKLNFKPNVVLRGLNSLLLESA